MRPSQISFVASSAVLNPFFSPGRKGGSCFCIHSALTPAPPQRQPSLGTVSALYLCIKWISCPPLFVKKEKHFPWHVHIAFPLKPPLSISIIPTQTQPVVSVVVDLDTLKIHTCSGPLCVSVYVVAWQGSAPSRPCEGLNVIHWAETVLLPSSLQFCLTPLMAAQSWRGQCHKQPAHGWKVLKCCTLRTEGDWCSLGMRRLACVGIEGDGRSHISTPPSTGCASAETSAGRHRRGQKAQRMSASVL